MNKKMSAALSLFFFIVFGKGFLSAISLVVIIALFHHNNYISHI